MDQPRASFDRADIGMGGTLGSTPGACKRGTDIACDGTGGYHSPVISPANTGEVVGRAVPHVAAGGPPGCDNRPGVTFVS
jgi:hypothetical protein